MSNLFEFFNSTIYKSTYTKYLYGARLPQNVGGIPPASQNIFITEDDRFNIITEDNNYLGEE